ncbi:MAG: hypothetical protein UV58_C0005G0019 [Candidatus Wolfebacteria bacterium GW2011_GWC1_43_10]|nr:MAG: hypothetical protein UV58_C0005G0019 [Candidatus Wolfebacteria bacterium GW2011_GWC1_43_10]
MEDGVTAVDFSPDGQRIAFLKENQSQTSVYIQDLAKAKQPVTLIVSLTAVDFNLLWTETGSLALTPKPSYFVNGQAWLINLSSRSLRWLGGGSGYSLVFSSPFNFGLEFSSSARTESKIGLIDKSGKSLAELSFSTVADKCSFSLEKKVAFCAVPYSANKSSGLVLPDDFLKRAVYFKDEIYRIDLESSAVDIVFDLEDTLFDMVDIKHRSDQLFFINRYDNQLYLYNLGSL